MSEKKETAKMTAENLPKYSVEELCDNSVAVFGKKKEVVIGALHNSNMSITDSYTKQEVQSAIDKFLKKEVK